MKSVLVTGGAGFIGSHLCEFLLEKGFKVICMDNYITGSEKNIRHLIGKENFIFIEHDVTQFIRIDEPLDYILHFASPASVVDYQKVPIKTLKVGALGTHNLLGLAMVKDAVFVLASTSEVYGDPLVSPQPETYWGNVNPIGKRACYDEAKRFAEAITMAYKNVHNVDVRIIRIFNTYGPRMRMDDGRVIPNFLNQALSDKPITVYGKGLQTRCFCYISDMIDGIYKVMQKKNFTGPVNIGTTDEITVIDLARKIKQMTNSRSEIIFKDLPEDDPHRRVPDNSLAKDKLSWQPKVGLDEGIKHTIESLN